MSSVAVNVQDNEQQPLLPNVATTTTKATTTAQHNAGSEKEKGRLGFLSILLGSIFFSLSAVLFRFALYQLSVPPAAALLANGLLLPLSVCIVLITGHVSYFRVPLQSTPALLLRGVLGAVTAWLLIVAFSNLPAGDVAAIFFTLPAFAKLLAVVVSGERLSCCGLGMVLISFVGGGLVALGGVDMHPKTALIADRPLGAAAAVGAAVVGGMDYAISRRFGVLSVHFLLDVAATGTFCLIGGLAFGGIAAIKEINLNLDKLHGWFQNGTTILLLAMAAAFLGQVGTNNGAECSNPGVTVVMKNLEVAFVYALAAILLREAVGLFQIIGAVFIFFSAIAISIIQAEM